MWGLALKWTSAAPGAWGREIRMRCLLRRTFVKHHFTSPSSLALVCLHEKRGGGGRGAETDRHAWTKRHTGFEDGAFWLRMNRMWNQNVRSHTARGLSCRLHMQYFWVHDFHLHCMCHHKAGKVLMTHNNGSRSSYMYFTATFLEEQRRFNHVYIE